MATLGITPPKVDGFLGLTVVKIEEGKYYPEYYANEGYYPLSGDSDMEWVEDWFDGIYNEVRNDSSCLLQGLHASKIRAKRNGYLVLDYSIVSVHPMGIVPYEISMIGAHEFLLNNASYIEDVYHTTDKYSDEDEKHFTLVFYASCDRDWESGHQECEPEYYGYFDYKTGEIK
jgi:hypothetical protein